jgi:8-oxo-dGTP pyrophosphatase MutT (NUDIX family)
MAPRLPARQSALSTDGQDCREAGVLVLLHAAEGPPAVVLTVRRDELPDHGGQLSFPGGRQEGTESLSDTALREAHEEIGLPPDAVQLLGPLTPLYIPPSNYCVHPFVGRLRQNIPLRPTDREVAHILHPSVNTLLTPATRTVETWTLHGQSVDVPCYQVEGHTVWGATAMMLAEFLAVVHDAL